MKPRPVGSLDSRSAVARSLFERAAKAEALGFFLHHAESRRGQLFPSRPATAASDAAETSVSLLLSAESRNVFLAASGADLTFATHRPLAREANVKSKAPLAQIFASDPFDSNIRMRACGGGMRMLESDH
jgi:hypothetical protein